MENLTELVQTAATELGFQLDGESVDDRVVAEVVSRYNRDIQRRMVTSMPDGPDEFKQAGWLTFWFRKLKPLLCPRVDDQWIRVNEVIAFTIGFCVIKSVQPGDLEGWGRKAADRKEAFNAFSPHRAPDCVLENGVRKSPVIGRRCRLDHVG